MWRLFGLPPRDAWWRRAGMRRFAAGPRGEVALGLLIAVGAALVDAPAGLLAKLRLLAQGVCAWQDGHVLALAGRRLPLCARDTGIYLGMALTLALLGVRRRRVAAGPSRRRAAALIGLCLLPLAVDGSNSLFLDLGLPHAYPPHNLLRLATGLLSGAALGVTLVAVTPWALDAAHAWPVLDVSTALAGVLLLVVAFAGIAAGVPALLYPVALLSVGGLVAAATTLNRWAVAGLLDGRAAPAAARLSPWLFSLLLALAELLGLSHLRALVFA